MVFDSPNLERRSTRAAFRVAHLCQKTEIIHSLPIVFNMFVGLDSRQAICYFSAQKVIQDIRADLWKKGFRPPYASGPSCSKPD